MLSKKFPLSSTYKQKLFQYARTFENVVWLDSQNETELQQEIHGTEGVIVALGEKSHLKCKAGNAFDALSEFVSDGKWAFGFLSYDLKNEIENSLSSSNFDGLDFPDLYFFEPEVIIRIEGGEVEVLCEDEVLHSKFCDEYSWEFKVFKSINKKDVVVESRLSKSAYMNKVASVKKHIAKGDVYEINFCHEFFAENANIDPFEIHEELMAYSPTPFSSFIKADEKYVLCASPERFIKKRGNRIVSQPIKGTVKRGNDDAEDLKLKQQLSNNPKERSENIMIVDLVRNDLSQVAQDG
ncbi:MAG: para-aminobenzoate synthetase component 1, partial [Saprospiraceae bacterium]